MRKNHRLINIPTCRKVKNAAVFSEQRHKNGFSASVMIKDGKKTKQRNWPAPGANQLSGMCVVQSPGSVFRVLLECALLTGSVWAVQGCYSG